MIIYNYYITLFDKHHLVLCYLYISTDYLLMKIDLNCISFIG